MSEQNDPHKSLDFSRQYLRSDENELDADTRKKLMQIRHRALESSLGRESGFPSWAILPIIGFITALIFIALVYFKPDFTPQADNSLEDLEVLISNDPIEFYENLDFLQNWQDR